MEGVEGDPPGLFSRVGNWFKRKLGMEVESAYEPIPIEDEVGMHVQGEEVVINSKRRNDSNREFIPCNLLNNPRNGIDWGYYRSKLDAFASLFIDRQSGYVFTDGEMTSDFTGGSRGKNGVIYNTMETLGRLGQHYIILSFLGI